jgi:hypothetical protein
LAENPDTKYISGACHMEKITILITFALTLTVPFNLLASEQKWGGAGDRMARTAQQSTVIHEEVVDGVKATIKMVGIKEYLKSMDMPLAKAMKETHHITVELKDAKTGKFLTAGDVKLKMKSPDKTDQIKNLKTMQEHFGGNFELSQKGNYGFICRFLLNEGKVRSFMFSYTVK